MPKVGKMTKRARATSIVAGLRKHFVANKKYELAGKTYTGSQLIGVFQSYIDAIDTIDETQAALASAVAKERTLVRRVGALTRYVKMTVEAAFGLSHEVYADFGWEVPKKPGPKTVEAKLAGATKAKETRKARGTIGKRQRQKVRGY